MYIVRSENSVYVLFSNVRNSFRIQVNRNLHLNFMFRHYDFYEKAIVRIDTYLRRIIFHK